MGKLGRLLNRYSDFSVRNGVLLYNQHIRPMIDYARTQSGSAYRTHLRRLHVLQFKILALLLEPPGTT